MMKFIGYIAIVLFFLGEFNQIDFKVYVGPHVAGEKVVCLRGKDADGQR